MCRAGAAWAYRPAWREPKGETTIWLQANIRFNRAVRDRAKALVTALGAYGAYREARRLRLEAAGPDARIFAWNVELMAAEAAGLSPGNPSARPLGPEAPIWFLPFLNRPQAEALSAWVERLLAGLMGAAAPLPAAWESGGEMPQDAPPPPGPELTARQIECLRWSAEGKSSWDIAQILGLSPRTVDEHLDNACRKLGVKRRAQAAVTAARAGLL